MATTNAQQPERDSVATRTEGHITQSLYWWDGFAISLSIPAALFIGIGYTIGALGAIPAIILSFLAAVFAALQNVIYSEMSSMFPQKSGGIAVYANEGWKNRNVFAGPAAAFGYWFAWASSLAIYSLQIGSLLKAQWFSSLTGTVPFLGNELGIEHLFAVLILLLSWGFNILGMRVAMSAIYVTGALVIVPILAFILAPLFTDAWSASLLSADWTAGGFPVWKVIAAWALIQFWSVYGIEAVATFTPEYKKPARDSRRALRMAGVFCVVVYALVPLGVGGVVGKEEIAQDPTAFYVTAFERIFGAQGAFMTVCIIAGLVLLMVMTTADGGRVLHGCANNGLTIKQLSALNRFGVPGRAMSMDVILNIILIFVVGSTLAVVVAGMIGIIVCHILALLGYVFLRRAGVAPNRETKLPRLWVGIAMAIACVDAVVLVVGAANAGITGYGGLREILISIAVLSISVLLYIIRRVVQDGRPLRLRNPEPIDVAPEAR
ncbi:MULTISPECIES: APC family permease [unclassified Mycolicibacterium]|uniref:APC family permease n=1 Tax=unclassified Mycolicibacterium TaxID=2636767 RepID=UPI0012DF9645|nr:MULTISPECIES: APC family permease [unclassified Mycolicibacterium]MUL82630.1 APC family permease [Mycolicibacterium sp. CBMA 329]MUL88965.1 APC family permease [Mycolicibacterium sp. CBMA 331]MUL97532.1 APC family permease [Mycolicibacterium sp. CBMA 334]MUM27215.1 APC family permease [Mycolicibacterium sp. CBMA 295]MUM38481.1 APC family permease [Mycolicibacterium sp. CBMA 247]